MIEPDKFALFIAASWALILVPRPDMVYVITRGMAHGRRAGIVSAVGVIGGILVHTTSAALGFALIFQISASSFLLVKYIGATYLIYLGVKTWMDKGIFNLETSTSGASSRVLFWQGVWSNILNPKIAIFFLAFLPQFVDQEGGPLPWQMAILGLSFAFFGLCFLAVIGYSAGAIGGWFTHRPSTAHFLRRLAGGILFGLGVRLAFIR